MTWLEQQVRNASFRQLGACALAIAGVIGTLAFNQRYLTNAYEGVYDIPRAEVLAVGSNQDLPRYWVKLDVDRVVDTGVDATSRGRRGRVSITGHYYIAQIGEKLLLIKAHSEQLGPQTLKLEGGLIAPNAEFLQQVANSPKTKDLRDRFLPMMLDTEDFNENANILLVLSAIVSGLAVLWALFAGYRAASPDGHAALQQLLKTSGETLAGASQSIEADVKARRGTKMKAGVQLTSGHLIQSSALTFNVLPLADLLWTYPIVTTKKLYGFIPTGKTHSAAFNFAGKSLTLQGSEQQTTAAMQHVARMAPWTLIGHSGELEKAYKKQRRELIGFVQGRRQQVQAAANAPPPPAGTTTA